MATLYQSFAQIAFAVTVKQVMTQAPFPNTVSQAEAKWPAYTIRCQSQLALGSRFEHELIVPLLL